MASQHASTAAATIAALLLLLSSTSLLTIAAAYRNYTVGEEDGWFFNSNKNTSATDYTAWASNKTFYLGDYLIFNTNSNSTVVHTFNETTYNLCNATDDNADNTIVYYDPLSGPDKYFVALIEVGVQYFFSDAYDGVQCFQGMRFNITVEQGQGLPPSLNQPPPPPYVDPPPTTPPSPSFSSSSQQETYYKGASVVAAPLGVGVLLSIVGVLFVFTA